MREKVVAVLFTVGVIYGAFYLADFVLVSPEIGLAILAGIVPAVACVWIILRSKIDHVFLLKLFIAALIIRWGFGYIVFSKGLQAYFGGDAITYDAFGNALCQAWQGLGDPNAWYLTNYTNPQRSGWGMFYYVAAVYYLIGQNPLAVQLISCALGAAACIAAYKIVSLIYPSQRTARMTALFTAFSPSLILWSSQILKDGLIVLFLCLCTLFTLKLRNKLEVKSLVCLLVSLFGVFALRHYVGYIMFIAIAGTFILTAKNFSPVRILQGGIVVLVMSMALAYFAGENVSQTASQAMDLKRIQSARQWSAKASESGFGGEVDISDPQAALAYLPLGMLYVLFAPFPWMVTNVRQLITLPELLVWWALFPLLLKGCWFSIRHRLRETLAIIFFTISLTLVYSLYQSNAGTAYRHRAQLYVFFFIFINIGLDLRRVAKEKKCQEEALRKRSFPVYAPAPASGNAAALSNQTG
jgi:hypothetical protein